MKKLKSTKCFCDDTYGRYEKRDNDECDFNCAGDFTQFCGGYYRNSIYRVWKIHIFIYT